MNLSQNELNQLRQWAARREQDSVYGTVVAVDTLLELVDGYHPASQSTAEDKVKKKRTLSPEERERRRQHMKNFWATKRGHKPKPPSP